VESRIAAGSSRCNDCCMATTVLVVDDHPSFRRVARALLEAEGYEVLGEAPDGAAALEAARRLRPDVVLLDIQLPDCDGFEVARALLDDEREGRPPVVVLVSSRSSSDYGCLVERSGAQGFLCKADLTGASLAALLT
jgi:CheY-like chemotaxis protein